MKGWHCQGQRAVAKVYAELQGPGQKHSPGLRAQGHPQEGGAMGAGNERWGCVCWGEGGWGVDQGRLAHQQMPRHRGMKGKAFFRNVRDAQEGCGKRRWGYKGFRGPGCQGPAQGLECCLEGPQAVELNDQIFALLKKVSYGRQTTKEAKGLNQEKSK